MADSSAMCRVRRRRYLLVPKYIINHLTRYLPRNTSLATPEKFNTSTISAKCVWKVTVSWRPCMMCINYSRHSRGFSPAVKRKAVLLMSKDFGSIYAGDELFYAGACGPRDPANPYSSLNHPGYLASFPNLQGTTK